METAKQLAEAAQREATLAREAAPAPTGGKQWNTTRSLSTSCASTRE